MESYDSHTTHLIAKNLKRVLQRKTVKSLKQKCPVLHAHVIYRPDFVHIRQNDIHRRFY